MRIFFLPELSPEISQVLIELLIGVRSKKIILLDTARRRTNELSFLRRVLSGEFRSSKFLDEEKAFYKIFIKMLKLNRHFGDSVDFFVQSEKLMMYTDVTFTTELVEIDDNLFMSQGYFYSTSVHSLKNDVFMFVHKYPDKSFWQTISEGTTSLRPK